MATSASGISSLSFFYYGFTMVMTKGSGVGSDLTLCMDFGVWWPWVFFEGSNHGLSNSFFLSFFFGGPWLSGDIAVRSYFQVSRAWVPWAAIGLGLHIFFSATFPPPAACETNRAGQQIIVVQKIISSLRGAPAVNTLKFVFSPMVNYLNLWSVLGDEWCCVLGIQDAAEEEGMWVASQCWVGRSCWGLEGLR